MQVSISQAHKMTGIARSTIYKDISAGKLSTSLGPRGKKVLDISELQRVYGEVRVEEGREQNDASPDVVSVVSRSKGEKPPRPEQVAVLQERIKAQDIQIKSSEILLERESQERERERRQLEARIESTEDSLKLAQEGHNKATLLLEYGQNGGGKVEEAIKVLETRLANQEKATEERELKIIRQNKALRKALLEERNKGVFKWMFRKGREA